MPSRLHIRMGLHVSPVKKTASVYLVSPAAAPQTISFRFMDLPPEICVQIYKNLAFRGIVFYTPDAYDSTTVAL